MVQAQLEQSQKTVREHDQQMQMIKDELNAKQNVHETAIQMKDMEIDTLTQKNRNLNETVESQLREIQSFEAREKDWKKQIENIQKQLEEEISRVDVPAQTTVLPKKEEEPAPKVASPKAMTGVIDFNAMIQQT